MATTDTPPRNDDRVDVGSAESCDVCDERRARWVAVEQRDFRVCNACREGEPCGRCGAVRDACTCREGPDIFTWIPIAGRG